MLYQEFGDHADDYDYQKQNQALKSTEIIPRCRIDHIDFRVGPVITIV